MTFDEIRHTWTSCKGESFIKKVAISQKCGLIGSEVNYRWFRSCIGWFWSGIVRV